MLQFVFLNSHHFLLCTGSELQRHHCQPAQCACSTPVSTTTVSGAKSLILEEEV